MKWSSILFCGAALSATGFSPANAQSALGNGLFYVEGQVGVVSVDDLSTDTFSGTAAGLTFTNVAAILDFNDATSFGVEFGYRFAPQFRAGLSHTVFEAKLEAVSGAGTVTDGTTTVDLSTQRATRASFPDLATLDTTVRLTLLNAYWDIPTAMAIRPFVGIGVGIADIENASDNEMATSFSLGAQYDLNDRTYVGVRYSRYDVDSPRDLSGFASQDIQADAFNVSFGFRF